MNAGLLGALVALGLGAVAARRTGPAAALVCAQTLLVGVGALIAAAGGPGDLRVAAVLLLAKGVAVSVLLSVAAVRLRERRPHDEGAGPLARLGVAAALMAALVALVPRFGLDGRGAEMATVALLAIALALVLMRRAAVFAPLALLVAENGVGVAAVSTHDGLPLVVEAGIAFDLVVLVAVAAVLQRRILDAFGTTDASALRSIRD
ncbi:MAG: hypothetical protein AB7V42_06965 [Thermoleophilia bacterium]